MQGLITREPYVRPAVDGPSTELDQRIVEVLEGQVYGWRPGQIATALSVKPQQVSVRVRVLTERGVLRRWRRASTPARGPGAYLYALPID